MLTSSQYKNCSNLFGLLHENSLTLSQRSLVVFSQDLLLIYIYIWFFFGHPLLSVQLSNYIILTQLLANDLLLKFIT